VKLFDTTLTHLERALDVMLVRHNVLAGNLANVDTPNFQPKEVDFATAMAGAETSLGGGSLTATDARHLGASDLGGTADVPITNDPGAAPTLDGNRVDLDRTMTALAENGLEYSAGSRAASKKLAILRYVASDGAV
jgi:flagellar basal-body rod protein FlgB